MSAATPKKHAPETEESFEAHTTQQTSNNWTPYKSPNCLSHLPAHKRIESLVGLRWHDIHSTYYSGSILLNFTDPASIAMIINTNHIYTPCH